MILLLLLCLSSGAGASPKEVEFQSISVKRFPVSNETQARQFFAAQEKYYELLFSPTRLAFSYWLRWLPSCQNFPGKMREHRGNLSLHIQTTTDLRTNEGYCGTNGFLKLFIVFSYCKGDDHVSEYRLPQSPQFSPEEIDLCL